MSDKSIAVVCALLLILVGAWTFWMLGVLMYYGSFVIEQPFNPGGAEAQLGALIGFVYSIPGLLALGAVTWFKRRDLYPAVALAPGALLLASCAYFGYLRFLVASASPQ